MECHKCVVILPVLLSSLLRVASIHLKDGDVHILLTYSADTASLRSPNICTAVRKNHMHTQLVVMAVSNVNVHRWGRDITQLDIEKRWKLLVLILNKSCYSLPFKCHVLRRTPNFRHMQMTMYKLMPATCDATWCSFCV